MGYERYNRGQRDPRDYSADNRDTYSSSARDYQAAGQFDRDNDRSKEDRSYYDRGYDDRSTDYYGRGGNHQSYGQRDYGRQDHSGGHGNQGYRQSGSFGESYGSNRDRSNDVEDYGRQQHHDQGGYQRGGYQQGRGQQGQGRYGRQPQGYDYQDRGFVDRAGDEVRSWFGDEEAERRREADARYDQQHDRDRDSHYGSWRRGQIAALDRDYDEYRSENRTKFESEFSNWRTERQGQRTSLSSVAEHMEVLGSDGSHVGTVDKVRGDRILLTKNDQDADGRHHSIPSRWIDKVEDKVTLRKTADEAKSEWRDEERNQALFGDDDRNRDRGNRGIGDDRGGGLLNRSFSGTY